MSQIVISKIEEDVLACALQRQRNVINELVDAIERRDISRPEIQETLKGVEDRLRILRKNALFARP